MKKVWIMAGETSGDLYGGMLAVELRKLAAERGETIEISGMGSRHMAEAGVKILVDSTELGVVGIVEVLRHIHTFVGLFFKLFRLACEEKPSAVIMVDYPGFNLRFAKMLKRRNIPVIWYISPQIWVWAKWRKRTLARVCSKMLVIFPFEEEVYADTALPTEFVGHPMVEVIESRRDRSIERDDKLILLLPGSRRMEVTKLLHPMLESILQLHAKHPDLRYAMALPREKIRGFAEEILAKFRSRHPELPPVEISVGKTSDCQQRAVAAYAASGTVTVESAIYGLPLVSIYKLNFITLLIGIVLVRLYRGFFTMVNIIAGKKVFDEYLQWRACPKNLVPAMEAILPGGSRRGEVVEGMNLVRSMLSPPNDVTPSRRAAEACFEVLTK